MVGGAVAHPLSSPETAAPAHAPKPDSHSNHHWRRAGNHALFCGRDTMDKNNRRKSSTELLAEELRAERRRLKRLRWMTFYLLAFACLCSGGIFIVAVGAMMQGLTLPALNIDTNYQVQSQPYTDPYANPDNPGLKYTKDVVKHIALYDFKITIPYDWELSEINRRHDPMAVYDHDCAEYKIQSPNGKVHILLIPLCGPGGGASEVCPDDVAKVSPDVYRYFSEFKQVYIYSDAMISTAYSNTEQLLCSGIISLGEIPNHVWMDVEVRSNQNISSEMFSQIDTIILSMQK